MLREASKIQSSSSLVGLRALLIGLIGVAQAVTALTVSSVKPLPLTVVLG